MSEVRESKRLTDSPCCLVNVEGGLSTQTQRLLKMANKEFTESPRILEINPSAPLIRRLCNLSANNQHHEFIKRCGLTALERRDDPGGHDARARGPGRPDAGVHDRGCGEAVAAHSMRVNERAATRCDGPLFLAAMRPDSARGWIGSAAMQPVEV